MFSKILIANRGEIACRVIKTARKMGIATVAVYSDADRDARHVELADEAVPIGAAPSRDSYLQMDRIIAACKQTGAQAVHPGYGFLSENAAFARRVEEEGIVFIGPKHASIAAMGDKIASKKLAKEAKVNTIPGWNEAIDSAERAVEIARDIGYPVMIKASAGGGGKGLRVAHTDKEAFDGFGACRNEAMASFGDDRIFIEKFIEEPRHIEIQVLGDAHGNVIFLNERECSIQRRHQKVIEEAPSPFISDETRAAMGAQAVQLAKAVDYQSAGTVEFVVGKDQRFYFLEMNTRLQVEHPVTECITGLDLVELMIRMAAGEALPLAQEDVRRDGWAIECRINAEDPFRNFLPSIGRLVKFQPPRETLFAADMPPAARQKGAPLASEASFGGVRVDTGVYEGGEISMYYDSMIAKLIVHAPSRSEAIVCMRDALDAFVIRGVHSNVAFQAALLAHPQFASGEFNTGFIAEHYAGAFQAEDVAHDDRAFLLALAGFVHQRLRARANGIGGQMATPAGASALSFKPVDEALVVVAIGADGTQTHTPVRLRQIGGDLAGARVEIGQASYEIRSATPLGQARIEGTVNGQPFAAQVDRSTPNRSPLALRIAHHGVRLDALVLAPHVAKLLLCMPHKPPPDLSRYLLSPMPGLLVELLAKPGQNVQAGEKLAVIEAMKMENVLFAAHDGVVQKVLAEQGQPLAVDQVILEFV
ncbi:MAG: acetyl/propionyl/methylcrotonyl-CoA carboxylase subunit alpha [Variovorax sp.]